MNKNKVFLFLQLSVAKYCEYIDKCPEELAIKEYSNTLEGMAEKAWLRKTINPKAKVSVEDSVIPTSLNLTLL